MVFETQGRTRNRTRDFPKKGSAFITSPATGPCVQVHGMAHEL